MLGIDRSGTSLLSEVVHQWGAYVGPAEHFGPADDSNPRGYWEFGPMQDIVSELITGTGLSRFDPAFGELVRQQASDPRSLSLARELISTMEAPARPWLWKEPDLGFVLPFWKELCLDPVYLVTLRNPYHSALSYEKMSLPEALRDRIRLTAYFFLRWQSLMVTVAREIRDARSKLFVSYEALLAAPGEQCARICRFLDAELGEGGGGPDRPARMMEAVDPGLWRSSGGVAFAEAAEASQEQKALYEYLSNRLDGDLHDFDPALYPFPPCWLEYATNMAAIRWLFANY